VLGQSPTCSASGAPQPPTGTHGCGYHLFGNLRGSVGPPDLAGISVRLALAWSEVLADWYHSWAYEIALHFEQGVLL
jgi:hypothetical protein